MSKIADIVESRLDEFAEAESRDQGKPVWLAKVIDVPRLVHNFRFFASGCLHRIETQVMPSKLSMFCYRPLCGHIETQVHAAS